MQNQSIADKGFKYTPILILFSMPFLMFNILLMQSVVLLFTLGMMYFGIKKTQQDKLAGKPTEKTRQLTKMSMVSATILTICVIASFFM